MKRAPGVYFNPAQRPFSDMRRQFRGRKYSRIGKEYEWRFREENFRGAICMGVDIDFARMRACLC